MSKLTDGERQITAEYLAGMIDADGNISIVKMKQTGRGKSLRYEVRVGITNTDLEFLKTVQSQLGGRLQKLRKLDITKNWKPSYRVEWTSKQSADILNMIQPHLIIKHQRCEVALELRATMHQGYGGMNGVLPERLMNKREALYQTMKKLNLRGLPL